VEGVDNTIYAGFLSDQVELEVDLGEEVHASLTLFNITGTLDVCIVPSAWPSWLEFEGENTTLLDWIPNNSKE
jgi:hypothetical protein